MPDPGAGRGTRDVVSSGAGSRLFGELSQQAVFEFQFAVREKQNVFEFLDSLKFRYPQVFCVGIEVSTLR